MKSKVIYVIGVTVTLMMFVVWLTSSHIWNEINTAAIIYDGNLMDTSRIYKSTTEVLLVSLRDTPNGDDIYLIYPTKNEIGMPNSSGFFFFSKFAFSKETLPSVVFMNDGVKTETDPNLIVRDDFVEFTTERGGRVKINLKGN